MRKFRKIVPSIVIRDDKNTRARGYSQIKSATDS